MSERKESAYDPLTIQPPQPNPEPAEPMPPEMEIIEQQEEVNEEMMQQPQEEEYPSESQMPMSSISGLGYDDPKTAGFRRTRNYQTEQQSLFIGLLNMVYNVTIDHPRKRSKITLPFFCITRISTDKEVIELKEIMSYRLHHLHQEDVKRGCSEKTAARRQEVYRVTEQLHILMNLLRDVGFVVESKKTTGNKGTQKETARKIYYNDFSFDRNFIEERGTMINMILMKKLETIPKSSELTIPAGDPEIAQILKFGMASNIIPPLTQGMEMHEEENEENNNENE